MYCVSANNYNHRCMYLISHLKKLVDEQYEAAKGAPVPKLTDAFKTPRLRQTMLLVAFV